MFSLEDFNVKEFVTLPIELSTHKNNVFIIQDAKKKYVLKELTIDPKVFEKIVILENELLRHKIPVPMHYQARDGGYVIEHKSCKYTLQEHIEGKSWSSSEIQIKNFASTLFQLHSIAKDFETDLPLGDFFQNCRELILNSEDELKKRHLEYQDENTIGKWKLIAKWIISELSTYQKNAAKLGYCTFRQPIHGDYHPLNTLYSEDGSVIAVVDFDQASLEDPLNDVIRAILHIYPFDFHNSLPNKIDEVKAQELWYTFIETYGRKIFERDCCVWIVKAISLELITLYHLKGLEKEPSITKVQSLVHQIEKSLLKIVHAQDLLHQSGD